MLDRRSLPLSALRAFECAGRYLHLGRAGEELGVTHGAISHQIRALESRLGVKLFTRASNRLQLTDSGHRLLAAVGEGFDRILDGALHLDPDSLSGNLVVGCTQTAGASWVAKHICEFHSQYPQIEVHVVEVKPQQKDIPREIDIAICYGKPTVGDREVEELKLLTIFPVCSPRFLHGKPAVTRAEHLTAFPLFHDGQNSWANWFSSMGVTMPGEVKQVHFFNTILSLNAARSGYGVALCNRYEVEEDLREGRLVQLLDSAIPESNSYYMLSEKKQTRSLRAQLFKDSLRNMLA